jgi:hypothetical protein
MKISAKIAIWLCSAFALLCAGFAFTGFSTLATITDQAERDISLGYSWFWTFLGAIGVGFGILSWLIKEGKFGDIE